MRLRRGFGAPDLLATGSGRFTDFQLGSARGLNHPARLFEAGASLCQHGVRRRAHSEN
jgi:hypothetical protein